MCEQGFEASTCFQSGEALIFPSCVIKFALLGPSAGSGTVRCGAVHGSDLPLLGHGSGYQIKAQGLLLLLLPTFGGIFDVRASRGMLTKTQSPNAGNARSFVAKKEQLFEARLGTLLYYMVPE